MGLSLLACSSLHRLDSVSFYSMLEKIRSPEDGVFSRHSLWLLTDEADTLFQVGCRGISFFSPFECWCVVGGGVGGGVTALYPPNPDRSPRTGCFVCCALVLTKEGAPPPHLPVPLVGEWGKMGPLQR